MSDERQMEIDDSDEESSPPPTPPVLPTVFLRGQLMIQQTDLIRYVLELPSNAPVEGTEAPQKLRWLKSQFKGEQCRCESSPPSRAILLNSVATVAALCSNAFPALTPKAIREHASFLASDVFNIPTGMLSDFISTTFRLIDTCAPAARLSKSFRTLLAEDGLEEAPPAEKKPSEPTSGAAGDPVFEEATSQLDDCQKRLEGLRDKAAARVTRLEADVEALNQDVSETRKRKRDEEERLQFLSDSRKATEEELEALREKKRRLKMRFDADTVNETKAQARCDELAKELETRSTRLAAAEESLKKCRAHSIGETKRELEERISALRRDIEHQATLFKEALGELGDEEE